MRGRVQVDDLPIARGEEAVAQGVDRDALADHLLREDGVGDLLDRREGPAPGEAVLRQAVGPAPVQELVPGQPTGTAIIYNDREGENMIVVAPGANHRMGHEDLAKLDDLEPGDVLLMPLELKHDVVTAAVELAVDRGARVILNLAPFAPLPAAVLASVAESARAAAAATPPLPMRRSTLLRRCPAVGGSDAGASELVRWLMVLLGSGSTSFRPRRGAQPMSEESGGNDLISSRGEGVLAPRY